MQYHTVIELPFSLDGQEPFFYYKTLAWTSSTENDSLLQMLLSEETPPAPIFDVSGLTTVDQIKKISLSPEEVQQLQTQSFQSAYEEIHYVYHLWLEKGIPQNDLEKYAELLYTLQPVHERLCDALQLQATAVEAISAQQQAEHAIVASICFPVPPSEIASIKSPASTDEESAPNPLSQQPCLHFQFQEKRKSTGSNSGASQLPPHSPGEDGGRPSKPGKPSEPGKRPRPSDS